MNGVQICELAGNITQHHYSDMSRVWEPGQLSSTMPATLVSLAFHEIAKDSIMWSDFREPTDRQLSLLWTSEGSFCAPC